MAADFSAPGLSVEFPDESVEIASAIKVLFGLTALSLAPALPIIMTSFTRIIVVLSMLRIALGMQQTPPNTVLISLALFLTIFNMMPVFEKIDASAIQPYIEEQISVQEAIDLGKVPLQTFMLDRTREEDLMLMIDLAKAKIPASVEDVSFVQLIPAFMLSELKTAFQIGFVIFLLFLLIDIVVLVKLNRTLLFQTVHS